MTDKSPTELLATPVQFLKGVGPQRAEALVRLDLQTARSQKKGVKNGSEQFSTLQIVPLVKPS